MKPKIIILAAGKSSRFAPFNQTHKSLHIICGQPILAHTLTSVQKAGFDQAIVVIGPNTDQEYIKKFAPQELELTFVIQQKPLGQANAILSAQHLVDESCIILNSQQCLFHQQINDFNKVWEDSQVTAAALRQKTTQTQNYGIFALDGDQVKSLVEKPSPSQAPSDQRLVGTYYMTKDFLNTLAQAKEEEYQLEAVINQVAKTKKIMAYPTQINPSLKYPWDLLKIKDLILSQQPATISPNAQIASTAIIRGNVTIESGAQIHDFAIIQGPAYIGKNALVGAYCQVRNNSALEEDSQIERYCDVRNSIIGPATHIHSEFIGDSILGKNGRIGAGFITANKRHDRKNIRISVKNQDQDTGRNNLGLIMGDNVKIGVNSSTMPGTILGNNSIVWPGITIKATHPDDSKIAASNL